MEDSELQRLEGKLSEQTTEEQQDPKRGGWITFPFIIGNLAGLSMASGGWGANWIVFLITKFNIGSITATKINNVGFGFVNLFPIAGAIIADSFFGNFIVITISCFIALLGMMMLTIIAAMPSLRPSSPCLTCESPTKLQYLVLYLAMGLTTIGIGGSRFTIATFGADQHHKSQQQAAFFNWYFFVLYVANAISFIGIVYVEDNVGWGLGFGICLALTALGTAAFLLGSRFYRDVKPKGSPFASIARVVVAAFRKRKMSPPANLGKAESYFYTTGTIKVVDSLPTKSFGFLNQAALKTENDRQPNGTYSKSWNISTVEEVEDLKTVIKIMPLWSAGILLSITIAIFNSLSTVQALAMNRHVGFIKIPAGTFLVFSLVSTALSIFFIDRFFLPAWRYLTGRALTHLQRVGIGHVINIVGMVGSALIEMQRLHLVRTHGLANQPGSVAPMSAMWLVWTLIIVGIGEGFQFPGMVGLYYQEFPESLKSTSTAMISLLIGLGYYLSAVATDIIDGTTGWLPDNINQGRVDNVYWLCSVIGVVNFLYYLVCAKLYTTYQRDANGDDGQPNSLIS